MIPAALVEQLETGLHDFLRASFAATTPGFAGAIDRLIDEPEALSRGPFVQVFLPFERGSRPDYFPAVPLKFMPHRHQERAFERLGGEDKSSTLVATGTGSGKTECFLWPILAHCAAHVGQPGIKAILVYPMNALASDQALRIARAINDNPRLKGAVTAGLYVGEGEGKGKTGHAEMGADHVVTDHQVLQQQPPDILLTNYKMLDYLLVRPKDRHIWKASTGGSLRFLVVDELHTFDGAQGTDLACLVRRLKDRLNVAEGQLCCVGTSATLGGDPRGDQLRTYAEKVFGGPFDEGAVITEERLGLEQFRGDTVIGDWAMPGVGDINTLDPSGFASVDDFLMAQVGLWLNAPLKAKQGSDVWAVELGRRLRQHVMLDNLLRRLGGQPRALEGLVHDLSRAMPGFREHPAFGRRALLSFLTLVSAARSWRDELPEARRERVEEGLPPVAVPFLQVRVQLWVRELRRMVASVEPQPRLRFFDDLNQEQRAGHLPVIHCRECGAMGWASLVPRDKPFQYRVELSHFYKAFFSDDARVRYVFHGNAVDDGQLRSAQGMKLRLERESLVARPHEDGALGERELDIVSFSITRQSRAGHSYLSRDCPFCSAASSLSLLGFQAATLTSVFIDQLFASPFNDDKKLLTFSDSVQDAAHRAGFFGARTWRFNMRVALQRVVDAQGGSLALLDLADRFVEHWKGSAGLDLESFICTFLAPNMEWLRHFEHLKEHRELPEGSDLLDWVKQRVGWEACVEYGLRSRIGRSLPRTSCSVAGVPSDLVEKAVEELLVRLRESFGGLKKLEASGLRQFVEGLLVHLLERGAVLHSEIPGEYIESGGKKTYCFTRRRYLPDYGPGSRLPALLAERRGTKAFDALLGSRTGRTSWYQRWFEQTLGTTDVLVAFGDAGSVYFRVLAALVKLGVLEQKETSDKIRVWGLAPKALRVETTVQTLRCDHCGRVASVCSSAAGQLAGAPCLSARCRGRMALEKSAADSYFGRLYRKGEIARIFAEEHTGLLDRATREKVEAEFKAQADRRPWYPNLLSCTPTLEMGIDIGDLSSAILCSVPPAQANYLQRIGRAGRRDGNAMLLTVANARNHDLYFYASPEEMIAGAVAPPDVYLDASAVLERQLTAFCFDRWAASGVEDDALPHTMREVYRDLHPVDEANFPHSWRAYVEQHEAEILQGFQAVLGEALKPSVFAHLKDYLHGKKSEDGGEGLLWHVLAVLEEEKKGRDALDKRAKAITALIRKRKKDPAKSANFEKEIEDLKQERSALRAFVKKLNGRNTLEFFTDEGLLPNYAFPQAPVRLRSVVWRKRDKGEDGEKEYVSWSYEYDRPGAAALSELAPESMFYASGRRVKVDQVDVQTTEIEIWRFCNACAYSERAKGAATKPACPSCGSTLWADKGQLHPMVKLKRVFANTNDRKSRLKDDRDDRTPKFYCRQTLVTFHVDDQGDAWAIKSDALPFAYEFLAKATFRDVNFGEHSEEGQRNKIGGKELVRQGFKICKTCGKVQPRRGDPEHTPWCTVEDKKNPALFEQCIYLFREFSSEAIRILLPIAEFGTSRQLHSFVAALNLGLREYFGGRVDHLHVAVDSEPVPGLPIRKQFLVLYDHVPGGTGYLKELASEPGRVLSLLEQARGRLATCSCASEPGRDGCYRCLLAYRNSYDMPETSRTTALELLSDIIAAWSKLEQVKSLGEVSVKGMLDSLLEARFLEALRRLGTAESPSAVTKALVAGKPGWRWSIGDRVWNIEPQVNLAHEAGLGIGISIDFVLHPGRNANGLKQAVFLDGWKYHRERVGKDMLQRMSLAEAGGCQVWSFSWQDVQAILDKPDPESHAELLVRDARKLGRVRSILDGHLSARRNDPSLKWFGALLSGDISPREWRQLAYLLVFCHCDPLEQAGADAIEDALGQLVPAQIGGWITSEATPGALGLRWPAEGSRKHTLVAAVSVDRARADLDALSCGAALKGPPLVAFLHDGAVLSDPDDKALLRSWNGYLRLANLLNALPGTWFLTEFKQDALDFSTLVALRSVDPGDESARPWLEVLEDVLSATRPLVEAIRVKGCPVPIGGDDLPDHRDEPTGVIAELVWHEQRIAVLLDEDLESGRRAVAAGWTLLGVGSLTDNLEPLLAALRCRDDGGDV